MRENYRALNRFGLGARVGEAARINDPRAWLREQLDPTAALIESPEVSSLEEIRRVLERERNARQSGDRQQMRQARRSSQSILGRESVASLRNRAVSQTPFLERLVAFWTNHLCISIRAKPALRSLAGHYERTVIRPHVLGRFCDMLLASARHPAMLIYLDNVRSVGPQSVGARMADRRGRQRGLNENYARELLELHTVGVNGGYSQQDVEQLALIFTGWTLSGAGRRSQAGDRLDFQFNRLFHQPGEKTVLGNRYSGSSVKEGEQAIRDLCRKEATAHFLAGKLVRHFVADEPPASAVQKIATVYSETKGDLRKISRALIDLDEAWEPENRKFRTPQDWLVATLRALEIREISPRLVQILQALRQPLWAPPAPKGYTDTLQDWSDPDSLMNRAELARTVAPMANRRFADASLLAGTMDLEESDPILRQLSDSSIPVDERIALALAGPAFQWR